MSETTENELPAYRPALLEDVEEAMRDVVDPELGVNVVDLGLVYGIDVDENNVAVLDMTLMQSKGDASVAEKLEDELEDAIAFAGVSKYPARIKCALMSWMALKDASARALAAAQTGGKA